MDLETALPLFNELMHRSLSRPMGEAARTGAAADVTASQAGYVRALARLERPTLSRLAKEMGVSKASASTCVHKLIHKGLAHAEWSSRDRRVVHLSLTRDGRKLADLEARANRELCGLIRGALTAPEVMELARLCGKVAAKDGAQ
jgi:DNA-binding MarR family transcriptional regulator